MVTSRSKDAASSEISSGMMRDVWDITPAGWQLCRLCHTISTPATL